MLEVITGCMYCHRKGQLVVLADGRLEAIENIRVGDKLISDLGVPTTVTALHRGHGEMALVRPVRGDSFVVTVDHELTLVDTPSKRDGKPCERGGRVVDVRVRDWLKWSKRRKSVFKLFQAAVPAFDSPGLGDDLPPYFMGAMIGDGSFDQRIGICNADQEVLDAFTQEGVRHGLRVASDASKGRAKTLRLVGSRNRPNPIIEKMRELGLYGLSGADKFIPQRYLSASWDDRREILAGLLDTDGSAGGYGFDFINKSERVADGVVFLARSLGLSAIKSLSRKKAQVGSVGTYFRVYIAGEVGIIPNRIPRKKITRIVKHRPTVRGFTVEPLPDAEPYYGVTVEGGRYLLGDFTVTHNSGKSEELIRRLRRCQIADQFTLVMKPAIDDRYSADSVATHVGETLEAVAVKDVDHVLRLLYKHPFKMTGQVIGVDEVQFLDDEIVDVLESEANRGRRVIVAGLDLDSDGHPFGPMARLLAVADKVTKLTAVCVAEVSPDGEPQTCGKPATRSYRLPDHASGEQVQVGSAGVYEARCRVCWARGRT